MKFITDLLTILIQLGLLGIVIAILLKLYPNFLPKRPVVREPEKRSDISDLKSETEEVDEDSETPKEPKKFWDDVNQLQMALDAGMTDFKDDNAVHLNDLGPLERQRELADRILELKDRQK